MYETAYHDGDLGSYAFLITGGAGFIGSHLTEYLARHGAGRIRILDDLSGGKRSNLPDYEGLEFIEGDICDPETCRRACKGMDWVLHQAALGSVPRSVKDPLRTNEVNITGFLNVLQAAAQTPSVRRMVYAASSSTYGDSPELPKVEDRIGKPLSPYAVTKYVNELYADVFSRLYGFHAVGLRYFNVFGPRQDPAGPYAAVIPLFMRAAIDGTSPLINGDGEQTRDFTFVENVVQANIRALLGAPAGRHEVYNVACGGSVSLNELWTILSALAGSDAPARHGPPRDGDIRNSLADISKARKMLGYEPRIDVRTGLRIALEWYKQ
ncbi:MAG TPA: SDR family oxidoreductase, partial [Dinghuibacter sp.]|uniref:SDR family oxidoreductase n=1 Tax=Dinghuibacter sp. TaxID=2024697 RepID=UPI002CA0F5E6